MTTGRIESVAVVLQSGDVLVAGGFDAVDHTLASSDIYDPATRAWSAGGVMPEGAPRPRR